MSGDKAEMVRAPKRKGQVESTERSPIGPSVPIAMPGALAELTSAILGSPVVQAHRAAAAGAFGGAIAGAKPAQLSPSSNPNGLPDPLRTNLEAMSGLSLGDVSVHRNSQEPGRLQALAYARGSSIHLGPGQEKHLPHEAWHVVQQKQGRVKPTLQRKGISINDDATLEREADVMGDRAVMWSGGASATLVHREANPVAQRKMSLLGLYGKYEDIKALSRELKINILRSAHRELKLVPTAWETVGQWIADHETRNFVSYEKIAEAMIAADLLVLRVKHTTSAGSQHTQNPMPKKSSVFSKETLKMVTIDDGDHRRHVIGRHTLGQAAFRSMRDDQLLGVIAFLKNHNSLPKDQSLQSLIPAAYNILQNYDGNLWPGDGGENSAIGLLTGPLYNWFNDMTDIGRPPLDAAISSLNKISTFAVAQKKMDAIKLQVEHILMHHIIFDKNNKPCLEIDDNLIDIINDIAKTLEFDLPHHDMMPQYNNNARQLFNRFSTSNSIFSDGTADEFMKLDWKKQKKPALPAFHPATTASHSATGGGGGYGSASLASSSSGYDSKDHKTGWQPPANSSHGTSGSGGGGSEVGPIRSRLRKTIENRSRSRSRERSNPDWADEVDRSGPVDEHPTSMLSLVNMGGSKTRAVSRSRTLDQSKPKKKRDTKSRSPVRKEPPGGTKK